MSWTVLVERGCRLGLTVRLRSSNTGFSNRFSSEKLENLAIFSVNCTTIFSKDKHQNDPAQLACQRVPSFFILYVVVEIRNF